MKTEYSEHVAYALVRAASPLVAPLNPPLSTEPRPRKRYQTSAPSRRYRSSLQLYLAPFQSHPTFTRAISTPRPGIPGHDYSSKSRDQSNERAALHRTQNRGGKQQSSLNAISHGLTAQNPVLPTEDLDKFQQHLKSFTDEYRPSGATETQLVQALADSSWRLNRILALETNIHDEANYECMLKALSILSIYTQRLSRQFEKTVTQLRDLQKTRQAQEEHDLDQFLDITEMYEDKRETYDGVEDGFVFSEDQIHDRIRARNRDRRADEALEYWETAA